MNDIDITKQAMTESNLANHNFNSCWAWPSSAPACFSFFFWNHPQSRYCSHKWMPNLGTAPAMAELGPAQPQLVTFFLIWNYWLTMLRESLEEEDASPTLKETNKQRQYKKGLLILWVWLYLGFVKITKQYLRMKMFFITKNLVKFLYSDIIKEQTSNIKQLLCITLF